MYSICIIIISVLSLKLFGYYGVVIFFTVCYWSGIGKCLNDRNPGAYLLADQRNIANPLYTKGFFRNKESKLCFLADLKGLYYCQITTAVFIFLSLMYKAVYRNNVLMIYGVTPKSIEIFLSIGLLGTMLVGIGLR